MTFCIRNKHNVLQFMDIFTQWVRTFMQTPQARRQQVFRLAMPAVSELVLNTLVGLVDILLVGQMTMATIAILGYGTAPALAATGLAGEMFWTMSLLFMAIGTGCTALVARATGCTSPGVIDGAGKRCVDEYCCHWFC
jgi:Na+-driven multidrug efflux pump